MAARIEHAARYNRPHNRLPTGAAAMISAVIAPTVLAHEVG
jgi:hypothetical protein